MAWWYCLLHQRVEQDGPCPNAERMGPYATQEEAAGALARAAERNRAFDAEDDD